MPLEIHLNANPREYYFVRSRQSSFLIEATGDGLRVVACTAGYARWILNQRCSVPALGEPLYVATIDDPNNTVIITTKIREYRKV